MTNRCRLLARTCDAKMMEQKSTWIQHVLASIENLIENEVEIKGAKIDPKIKVPPPASSDEQRSERTANGGTYWGECGGGGGGIITLLLLFK